jgi:hypothetical protein
MPHVVTRPLFVLINSTEKVKKEAVKKSRKNNTIFRSESGPTK